MDDQLARVSATDLRDPSFLWDPHGQPVSTSLCPEMCLVQRTAVLPVRHLCVCTGTCPGSLLHFPLEKNTKTHDR